MIVGDMDSAGEAALRSPPVAVADAGEEGGGGI